MDTIMIDKYCTVSVRGVEGVSVSPLPGPAPRLTAHAPPPPIRVPRSPSLYNLPGPTPLLELAFQFRGAVRTVVLCRRTSTTPRRVSNKGFLFGSGKAPLSLSSSFLNSSSLTSSPLLLLTSVSFARYTFLLLILFSRTAAVPFSTGPSNFLTPQAGNTAAPNPCSYCCCTQCCGCGLQLVARNSGPLYHPVTPYIHPSLTSISIVNRYSNRQLVLNNPAEDQLAQAQQNGGVFIFQNGLLNRPAGGYLYHGHGHEEQTANTGLVLLPDEKRCQDLQLVVVGPQDNSPSQVDDNIDMSPRFGYNPDVLRSVTVAVLADVGCWCGVYWKLCKKRWKVREKEREGEVRREERRGRVTG
ncbi:hypothetical protein J6590_016322 [Homalodisca vitripennis]|nr:hypothetical protein J6590_016322 [Homalodisca vitripennis]